MSFFHLVDLVQENNRWKCVDTLNKTYRMQIFCKLFNTPWVKNTPFQLLREYFCSSYIDSPAYEADSQK